MIRTHLAARLTNRPRACLTRYLGQGPFCFIFLLRECNLFVKRKWVLLQEPALLLQQHKPSWTARDDSAHCLCCPVTPQLWAVTI